MSLGALGVLGAIGAASDVLSVQGSYAANKKLMEQQQDYNVTNASEERTWQAAQNDLAFQRQLQLESDARDFTSFQNDASRNWQSIENQLSRDWQSNANQIAMEFNRSEAAAQRQWQEYMSNTAHQRAVADLKKAGLNPILAVSSGGASFGSGSAATGVANSASTGSPTSSNSTTGRSVSMSGSGSSANVSNPGYRAQFQAVSNFIGSYLRSAREVFSEFEDFKKDISDNTPSRKQIAKHTADLFGMTGKERREFIKNADRRKWHYKNSTE